MKSLFRYLGLSLLLFPLAALAQKEVVQFSGMVKDAKINAPLPFCGVFIQGTYRGTTTNMNGFFSLPAAKGDTIVFQSLGYRDYRVVIPADLKGSSYSRDVSMFMDTFRLQEVVIVPLPSPNQLRQAIITLEIPDELEDLALTAFEQARLDKNTLSTSYDGSENYKNYLQQYVARQYFAGQSAPIQLMNPFAWAQFIQSLKNGDFKRK